VVELGREAEAIMNDTIIDCNLEGMIISCVYLASFARVVSIITVYKKRNDKVLI
jgi:hypothetical protein